MNSDGVCISLKDRVAVVTGGSRGIGAAIVKTFCAAGAKVVFNYRQARPAADALAAGCGGSAIAVKANLAKVHDAEKLVAEAVKRFGRLDILVANAGIWNADDVPIDEMTEQQWDEMVDINLKGVFGVTKFAVAQMKKQRSGRIIAISSTAGQRGEAFHSHYGATKGGVISFVKGLSTELAPHNILVNCVAPGWVMTDMAVPALQTDEQRQKVFSAIPLRRIGTPEEIAGPVLFLASDMASFITGEIVNVNGGAVLVG
jgi:3-oxoacyl-[acyl-carrier protein] reductase